jgi:hypothetical protein
MCFQQLSPVRSRLALRAAQTLRREPHQLMSLEKIYVPALERLTHIAWKVEDRQVLADETTHPDRCFTREQRSQGGVY